MELIYYYITLFVVSLLATWWIFKKVLRIAKLKNIVDNPGARKLQRVPVPVLGGAAVFFGMIAAFAAAGLIYDINNMLPILCAMTIMLFIGTLDDIIGLSPNKRIVVEAIVFTLLLCSNHYSIDSFHGLWGIYQIPLWISYPLTIFTCVGIINAINMMDGVNGLSSGYCIVTSAIFGAFFLYAGDSDRASLAILAVGALLPFFFHNVFGDKSKMFIGDGGALLMGVIMSAFVINTLKTDSAIVQVLPDNFGVVPFTLALLAVPVFDTLRVMLTRIVNGVSPFTSDKNHLHHILFDLHFSHIGTTTVEIIAGFIVLLFWCLSYILGASIDVQLYVVITMGFGITFAFAGFVNYQKKKQGRIYKEIIKIGDRTHVGHTKWFERITRRLDRNC